MFSILKLTSDQTIGPGEPGAKSAALRQHKNLVETLNLADNGTYPYSQLKYIPQVALTPESFSPFFSRAGASIEKPEESQKAIQKTSFNKAEMDALKLSLSYYGNEYIAIRSDEQTASGVGLWETRFMWTKNPSRSFSAYARKVKEVLASDYSENVIAFKKRTGISLDRPVGVFLMNLSGSLFQCDIGPGVGITTPIHAKIITTKSNGFPIASMRFSPRERNINFSAITSEYGGVA